MVAGAAWRRAAIRKWVGTHDPVAAWRQAVIGGRRNRAYVRASVLGGRQADRQTVDGVHALVELVHRRAEQLDALDAAGELGDK